MGNTEEIIVQPSPYGLVIKDIRLGIVLIFVVAFLLCVAFYFLGHMDNEPKFPERKMTEVSQITDSVEITITATPAYTPPSE